jgi:hypothetical protein
MVSKSSGYYVNVVNVWGKCNTVQFKLHVNYGVQRIDKPQYEVHISAFIAKSAITYFNRIYKIVLEMKPPNGHI